MRLTDAVFARMIVDVRSMLESMTPEHKADFDGEFLTAIAEQPNEILKCAMYLFLGYLDGATQFAQSCGGGDSSLPWGRKEEDDDRRFAYRCMMQAHKMLKPSQLKRGLGIRLCNQRPFTSLSSQIFIGFAVSHHCFHVCLCPFCKLLYEREK